MNISVEDCGVHWKGKHSKEYWNNRLKEEQTCLVCEYLYDENFWNWYWEQK